MSNKVIKSLDNHYETVKQAIKLGTSKNIIIADINNTIATINGVLASGYIDEKQHSRYKKKYQELLDKMEDN